MKMLKALALGLSLWGTAAANVQYTNDPSTIPTQDFTEIDQLSAQLLYGKAVSVSREGVWGFDQYLHNPSQAIPLGSSYWVLRSDYLMVVGTIAELYHNRRDLLDCFLRYYDMWSSPPFMKFHIGDGSLYKRASNARYTTPSQPVGTMQPAMELAQLGLMEVERQNVTIPQVVWYILGEFIRIDRGRDLVVTFSDPVHATKSLLPWIKGMIKAGLIKPAPEIMLPYRYIFSCLPGQLGTAPSNL